jgi:hypothetical protein
MTRERARRILRASAVLVVLALMLVVVGMTLTASPAHAGVTYAGGGGGELTKFGGNVTVGPGQHEKTVIVFGGNATVNGTVDESVVAIGGDATVAGTVGQSVVAIGGDVVLRPTAVVGHSLANGDPALVSVGGTVRQAPGAQVTGGTKIFKRGHWLGALGPLTRVGWWPRFGWSLTGWVIQTAIFLVLGLVAAALMPRQLLAVERHVMQRPGASLGWGALTFFVIVPVALVLLVATVIGIVVAIPLALFALPLGYFFVTTGVAAMLAQRVLASGGRKQNLMAAVAVGIVATTLVTRIPVAGIIVLLVMTLFGTGAAVLALLEWRRERRPVPVTAGPGGPHGAGGGSPGGYGGGPGGATPPSGYPGATAGQPGGAGPSAAAAPSASAGFAAASQVQAAGPEAVTQVQATGAEPVTQIQPGGFEPVTELQAGPAVEAPQAPVPPAPPDASLLPLPSSHVLPPRQQTGQE